MREPVAMFSGREAPKGRVTKRKAKGAAATGARPKGRARTRRSRSKVPGGKALARIRYSLVQRGLAEEPTPAPAKSTIQALRLRPPGESEKDVERLVAGRAKAQSQLAAPDAVAFAPAQVPPSWRPLGPYFIPHGQTYGSGRGSRPPVSGRVSSIAIDPTNEQHLLCGAAGGGVWESTNGGQTWLPRTDDQPSLSIGAVAFDPSNARRVYAGTGEGDTAASYNRNPRAVGMLVSDDGGTTWSVMPSTPFVGASFFDLVIDPADSRHLLAATTNGLYETKDGGQSWSRRRTALTWKLSMHPLVPTNPQAGREVLAACADGLFRSTNGGTTWSSVTLAGLPAGGEIHRMAVAHCASNGSVAYVFAAGSPQVNDPVAAAEGSPDKMPKPYLWRRAVFGGSFTTATPPPRLQTGQAWYDWCLGVAPNNPNIVYVGGINVHRGTRQANGGWIWADISAKGPPGDSIHPDQHAIAFSPHNANVVYIGNDGGVYRSPDAGITWETLNKGLSITEIEFMAQHPRYDAWLLAGTQDNGTLRYEGLQTWYHVQDGDGGDCGVNDTDPYTCFHSFYGPYLERSTVGGAWNTWSKSLNINEGSLFYPPLEVRGRLVVRGATKIWLSRDAGRNWTSVSLPGLRTRDYPSALAIAGDERIYTGTTQGECYVLERSGTQWVPRRRTRPAAGYMSDVLVEPGSVDRIWCTVNVDGEGSVFHSGDGGVTWTRYRDGIPTGIAMHAVEIDPLRLDQLYVGTDVGVFRTTDGGRNWTAFGRGLPNVLVKDLVLHAATGLLRAGTQARGVWEIDLNAATMSDVHVYLRDHAADTGRQVPSESDVPSPFEKGAQLFWWQSPDIKVDASPFAAPQLHDLDFAGFTDDRSKREGTIEFATGLRNDQPVQGQAVRVYVQAHNRGVSAAVRVAVRVYYAAGNLTWPDLPAGFWDDYPQGALPADSPWQPVAGHKIVDRIEPGRSEVVGFDWTVPDLATHSAALLAVISAENDTVDATALGVSDLVRQSRFCALRNLAVVNPPPLVGPQLTTFVVDFVPAVGRGMNLGFDANGASFVKGVVLPKNCLKAAERAGWKPRKLSAQDIEALTQLTDARPELKKQLHLKRAFRPNGSGLSMRNGSHPSMVLLIDGKSKRRTGSVVVRDAENGACGGVTLMRLDS